MSKNKGGKVSGASTNQEAKTKKSEANSSSQIDKIKEVENALSTLLTSIDPSHDVNARKPGGMEGRVANIVKMTSKIREISKPSASASASPLKQPLQHASIAPEAAEVRKNPDQTPRKIRTKPVFKPFDFSAAEREFTKYFLSIPEQLSRTINPYAIIQKIKDKTGYTPKEVTGFGRNTYTIQVANRAQADIIQTVTNVEDILCKIQPHPTFNVVRGLIYLYDSCVDDLDQFKDYLKPQADIVSIIRADFIKTRQEEARAYIIEFNQDYLPRSLCVAGERATTTVYEFKNRPMNCNKCLKYGHREKYCLATAPTCRKCSIQGHRQQTCSAPTPKCLHCENEHAAGNRECEVHQKEQAIVDIQAHKKVTMRRARQIYDNNTEVSVKTIKYNTHFNCVMREDDKKTMSPWLLEKCFSKETGCKPKSIRSLNSTTYLVEVTDQKHSEKLASMKLLNDKPISVEPNMNVAVKKGLIYLYNYDMKNFESFRKSICKDLGLAEATRATWIKARNEKAVPLILDFRGELPAYVTVPGEQSKTKVFEHIKTPMLCKRCKNYNHPEKYCEQSTVCGRCSAEGHREDNCERAFKCLHCSEPHAVGSKQCREDQLQREILAIQYRENVPRRQALVLYRQRTQNQTVSYASATSSGASSGNDKPSTRKRNASESSDVQTRNEPKRQATQVVCESPKTGRLFTTTVQLDPRGSEPMDRDDEENDLENYQRELKTSNKPLKTVKKR